MTRDIHSAEAQLTFMSAKLAAVRRAAETDGTRQMIRALLDVAITDEVYAWDDEGVLLQKMVRYAKSMPLTSEADWAKMPEAIRRVFGDVPPVVTTEPDNYFKNKP